MRIKTFMFTVVVLGCGVRPTAAQPAWSGPFVRAWSLDGAPAAPLARSFGVGADLDQDGRDDIVLGNEPSYCGHGAIAAFRGLNGFPLWQVIGPLGSPSCLTQPPPGCAQTYLGHKRVKLVDLDGDQASDVLASGWGRCHASWLIGPNAYGSLGGSIWGFRGVDGTPLFEVIAPAVAWSSVDGTGGYGWSFDGGEDVTGDGLPDVVGAAYGFALPGEGIYRGAIFGTPQMGSTPFAVFPGVKVGDFPGGSPPGDGAIEFLDDVDGDGVMDFLASSASFYLGSLPPDASYVPKVGIVRLHSGATFQVINSAQGTAANDGFGHWIGSFPDIDGDGFRDFFTSVRAHAYISLIPPLAQQRVEVRSGADFSLIRTIFFVDGALAAQNPYEREIGPSVAGDVDGDGVPEVVLPSCGSQNCVIRVVSLGTGITVHQWVTPSGPYDYWMGSAGGDLNGDGLSDIVLVNMSASSGGPGTPIVGHVEAWLAQNMKLVTRPALGNQAVFAVHMPKWPNRPYRLLFSQGTAPPVVLGPYVIPLALDAVFSASLWNWFGAVLDGSGKGSFAVTIPNSPALSGMTFYASGIAVDSASPFGIAAVLTPVKVDIP